MEDLVVEDVDDGETKVGGSFRGSLSMNSSGKCDWYKPCKVKCKLHFHALAFPNPVVCRLVVNYSTVISIGRNAFSNQLFYTYSSCVQLCFN